MLSNNKEVNSNVYLSGSLAWPTQPFMRFKNRNHDNIMIGLIYGIKQA